MKQILFFILGITIFWPLNLFMAFSYGTTSGSEPGWYQDLWDKEKGLGSKVLFILLGFVFLPLVFFMRIFYPIWEELGD